MELNLSRKDGYVCARTIGPIDHRAGDAFREYLHPLLQQAGTQVILDVSRSGTITSSGLGELVALVAAANMGFSRVILAGCSPYVSVILRRSKLESFFETASTAVEAAGLLCGGFLQTA